WRSRTPTGSSQLVASTITPTRSRLPPTPMRARAFGWIGRHGTWSYRGDPGDTGGRAAVFAGIGNARPEGTAGRIWAAQHSKNPSGAGPMAPRQAPSIPASAYSDSAVRHPAGSGAARQPRPDRRGRGAPSALADGTGRAHARP